MRRPEQKTIKAEKELGIGVMLIEGLTLVGTNTHE